MLHFPEDYESRVELIKSVLLIISNHVHYVPGEVIQSYEIDDMVVLVM